MTIQQLRYIIALDEERNFSKAAEACAVSQPGLTIQLKNLEEEIGIRIFDRNKVPLKPTTAGIEIILRAKKIIREAEGIRNYVATQKNSLEGEIKLGVISTLSPYLIPNFIGKIKDVTPAIHYIIKEASTYQLMQDLETGAIDIALMSTPTGHNGFKEFPIFLEPFVAYLNINHPAASQLHYSIDHQNLNDLLLLKNEYCYNAQLLDICELKSDNELQHQFNYDINSIETLKNLVKAGQGFAIIPKLAAINEMNTKSVKTFTSPQPVREISLVVSDTFTKKLLLEKMSEAMYECIPEDIKGEFPRKKIKWNDSPYFNNILNGDH